MVVTHDVLDALLLSDRVIVLEAGGVVEHGATDDVLRHPRSRFAARIAGLNVIRGLLSGGVLRTVGGLTVDGVPREAAVDGDEAAAAFAPTSVAVFADQPGGSARNAFPVTVVEVEPIGDLVRVGAETADGHHLYADVTARSAAELDVFPGRDVIYSVKAASVVLYRI